MAALPQHIDDRWIQINRKQTFKAFSTPQVITLLEAFLNVPGIEAYRDLEEGTKDIPQLEAKAQVGLPHYEVLLSYAALPSGCVAKESDESVRRAIDYAIRAANHGDREGSYEAAELLRAIFNSHRLGSSDEEAAEKFEQFKRYLERAAWSGLQKAYQAASIHEYYDTHGIPGTGETILGSVQKFLQNG